MPRNVLSGLTIRLTGFYSKQYYPEPLRLVQYWDQEQEREFTFLINANQISALHVTELYKKPLAGRALFQVAKVAPQNQKILEN